MKQYAASGIVERSGSTSVIRNSRSAPRRNIELAVDGESEETGRGSAGAFSVAAWAEDMLQEERVDQDAFSA